MTPVWSRTSRELFFGSPDGKLIVVPYTVDAESFRPKSRGLSPMPGSLSIGGFCMYDAHPDGKRFATLKPEDAQADSRRDRLVFISNFFDELRRVAGTGKK